MLKKGIMYFGRFIFFGVGESKVGKKGVSFFNNLKFFILCDIILQQLDRVSFSLF